MLVNILSMALDINSFSDVIVVTANWYVVLSSVELLILVMD